MNISNINNDIYLGGLGNHSTEEIKNFLIDNNIKCIITIWNFNKLNIKKLNINVKDYMYIHAYDLTNEIIIDYFDITNKFIINKIKEGKKVLIHCYAGISRSASIVINYFMNKYNINYDEAEKIVSKKRNIKPNIFFILQLKFYNSYKNINIIYLIILFAIRYTLK
ncbi:protein tyrosine phosphatase [Betaentomopoxvirus amoorei]|uniref:Putative tyrosine-protein phosphatase AMV078 n=1 Tax=Amsacta moorei entomopoxvirus TaxID=28321 RepID=PTPH_AMEPV|nr:protein tyrosine phosphatase [Amsacta moorei entomopoxvirus]Q9EMX1.1 RecName: Full=Putative tyrosine-protein phosphatase AMV078 [Amsacta moorei entomopoxvirus]AAG02784.1 AMV078 [Amsacta moorei entomopoxvirus]